MLRTGDVPRAIAMGRRAVDLRPDLHRSQYGLGTALIAGGFHERGLGHLREAVRLNPHDPRGHMNLGRGLALGGEKQEAIDHLVEALRLDPALTEAGNYLAHVLVMTGDIDGSFALHLRYRTVAGVSRAQALAHVIAGERRLEAGATGDALREYRRALEIDPANPVARARIAAAMETSAISSVPTAP